MPDHYRNTCQPGQYDDSFHDANNFIIIELSFIINPLRAKAGEDVSALKELYHVLNMQYPFQAWGHQKLSSASKPGLFRRVSLMAWSICHLRISFSFPESKTGGTFHPL
jgi:hypothetical protein